jgi:L-amino acid N-acyltransferase YncA
VSVHVRDARDRDAARVAEIYRPYVERSVATFEESAPDVAEVTARMRATPRLPWLVADDEERGVVGYAYATRHRQRAAYRWAVDCSVYVDPDAQGRGVGRLLYSALLPLLREHGYLRAHAGIALPNPASVALHESMGFTPVGVFARVGYKHGAWHDVGWWQRSLAETGSPPPAEPRPWRPVGEQ